MREAFSEHKAEAFFLRAIADLDETALKNDWYETLRGSAIMRQLLLDGMLSRANTRFCLKFKFRINDVEELPADVPSPESHWFNLDPGSVTTREIIEINRDAFLARKCMLFKGQAASVKDVINACANSKGGVHYGPAKTEGDRTVIALDEAFKVSDVDISYVSMTGLFRITLVALKPLVSAILEDSKKQENERGSRKRAGKGVKLCSLHTPLASRGQT
ncbi:hypothetical protein CMV30_15245 [Nibricoccus aquaticus]|uniref:Uncharacterized protein n=1 Tax=Nibricoccus aquaticus TaxID=2576891 RepID=A0A290QLA3_9BACT|nr:hypothetical protein CMV30_15245 [Nibricoccus aquaticus]